jgi:hypothetical protein
MNYLQEKFKRETKGFLHASTDGDEVCYSEAYVAWLEFRVEKSKEKLDNSITWGVEDFKVQAANEEDPDAYDPELFADGLERMIYKHDANNGITWDTISYYLDAYCRKDKE